ncbi:MAG: hypothetical protein KKE20_03765 [Nanoarchaeota archaeon]|nr:hypothetical protein [Nanoarchaeota archaeon]
MDNQTEINRPQVNADMVLHRISQSADQSSNASKVVNLLLSILERTSDNRKRQVIINSIDSLKNMIQKEDIEKGNIKKQVDNLHQELAEKRKLLDILYKNRETIARIFSELESFIPEIQNIRFDEHTGFGWKGDGYDNVTEIEKLDKTLSQSSDRYPEISNKSFNEGISRLHSSLSEYYTSGYFNQIKNIFADLSRDLELFFSRYKSILDSLSSLKHISEEIIFKRRDIQKYSSDLQDPDLARKINLSLKELALHMESLISSKTKLINELDIITDSLKQIIGGLEQDISYLKSINSSKTMNRIMGRSGKPKLIEPYYLEARTAETFFRPKYGSDSTGVFDRKESHNRLFNQVPIFDNNQMYSMNDDISVLMNLYFRYGDLIMDDFKGYYEELLDLAKRSPKLDPSIRGILAIPVYMEEKSILKTLENYGSCRDFDKIAIVLLENLPLGAKRDFTLTGVQLFRVNHPNVKVYHLFKAFKERMPIGYLRKYIADYALLLKQQSGDTRNFFIVGGDGDCIDISPDFFSEIIDSFFGNPNLDAVEMQMNFPIEYRIVYPNLWVMHRAFDFAWAYMRHKVNPNQAIRMYGPASAIKSSSYLMIKGFNPRTRLCEDLQLSWLLDEGRRSAPSDRVYFSYLPKANIVTNPRRAISSYLSNVSFLDIYEKFEEKDSIRSLGWEKLIEDESIKGVLNVGNTFTPEYIREAIEHTNQNLSHEIATTLAYNMQRYVDWWQYKIEKRGWMTQSDFEKMISRIMRFLGIEYRLEFSTPNWIFTILNIDALEKSMNEHLKAEKGHNKAITLDRITIDLNTYKHII